MAGACLLALACVAAMQPSAAPAPTQDAAVAASAPLTPKLAALAQSDPGRRVDVIVRLRPDASAEAARSFVRTAGGHAGEPIGLINASPPVSMPATPSASPPSPASSPCP